jgi:hypothetical protein
MGHSLPTSVTPIWASPTIYACSKSSNFISMQSPSTTISSCNTHLFSLSSLPWSIAIFVHQNISYLKHPWRCHKKHWICFSFIYHVDSSWIPKWTLSASHPFPQTFRESPMLDLGIIAYSCVCGTMLRTSPWRVSATPWTQGRPWNDTQDLWHHKWKGPNDPSVGWGFWALRTSPTHGE